MLEGSGKSELWSKSIINPVPKKGDPSEPQNHRGIALIPTTAKIYNRVLLNRIRPHLEPLLRTNKNWFQPGRSTVSQILTLRRFVEGIKAKNLTAVLTVVDFKKAFDSVNRDKMFEILKAYGILNQIVLARASMYYNTEAIVCSPGGETDFFAFHAGVLQGDTLAPYLLIIALDYAMRSAIEGYEDLGFTLTERRSRRSAAVMITDTDFADDIALISNNLDKVQSLLEGVETGATEVALHINTGKTEYMAYNLRHRATLLPYSQFKAKTSGQLIQVPRLLDR